MRVVSLKFAIIFFAALGMQLHFCVAAMAAQTHAKIDTVIVEGQRAAVPYRVDQVDIEAFTGFARVVERAQFEHKFTSLADILDKQLGVQLRQSGGVGGYTQVSMRGSASKQLNVFLDGVLVNSAQGGTVDLNLIPLSNIQRIEVYPDFTPVQLGNANISGAINIVTQSEYIKHNQISAKYGSYNTKNTSFMTSGDAEKWHYTLGYEYLASDNDYKVLDVGSTPDAPENHSDRTRNNNDVKQESALAKLSRSLTEDTTLHYFLQFVDVNKAIPDKLNLAQNDASLNTEVLRNQLRLNTRFSAVDASHRLYWFNTQERYDDRQNLVGRNGEYLDTELDQIGLLNTWGYQWRDHFLTLNIEYFTVDFEKQDLVRQLETVANKREGWVAGLQDDWRLLNDRLEVSAIYRHYRIKDETQQVLTEVGMEQLPPETLTTEDSFHLGMKYELTPAIFLKANLARAVRIPTLLERFGEQGLLLGAEDLRPESSDNMDLGIEFSWPTGSGSLSIYQKKSDDFIVVVYDSSGIGKPENVGEVLIKGIEGEVSWILSESFTFLLGFEFLDTENRTEFKAFNGRQLAGVYETHGMAALNWADFPYQANVSYSVDDDLFYDQRNAAPGDRKELLDLDFTRFIGHLTLNASITNILNKRYDDFHNFEGAGIGYYLAATYDW